MTLRRATEVLSDQACNSFAKVTLIEGLNDSLEGTSVYDMTQSLTQTILQAKAITHDGKVKVSSILLRINDEKTQLSMEQMYSSAKDVCKKTQDSPSLKMTLASTYGMVMSTKVFSSLTATVLTMQDTTNSSKTLGCNSVETPIRSLFAK